MSRRSSVTSLTTSASGSTTGEDSLMRDCYNLRRRLLQTEQSIKNLNPPFIDSSLTNGESTSHTLNKLPSSISDGQINSHFTKHLPEPSDPAPVLTLADLSPAASDTNFDFNDKLNITHQLTVQKFRPSSSDPTRRIPEIDRCSMGSSGDFGGESLRKKLYKLREENTSLVNQNHNLMTELEKMEYELHHERNNVKILTVDLEEEKKGVQDYEDRIIDLEKEISSKQDTLKSAEDKLLSTIQQLEDKASELNNVLKTTQDLQLKHQEELKLRKHLQDQLEETLRSVEELTGKMTENKEREKQQNQMRCEQLEKMDRELNELTNERNELQSQNTSLEGQMIELKEEIRLLQSEGVTNEEYKSSLERDNANLRSTVARQSQRVGQLEKQSPRNEEVVKLHEIVEMQNERIRYYQEEIEQSKADMLRLESWVQQIQEQSVRRCLYQTPSTVDRGNIRNIGVAHEDGGTMTGLRSELSFIAERNRINDRKQQELEQVISRMEDEAASYSAQLIELEEKLAEKGAMNVSLEGKVNQQNLRVADLKADLEQALSQNSELQRQVNRKTLDIEKLERQLEEKVTELRSHATRLQERNQNIEEKDNYINELETTLKTKESDVAENRNLLEKTRSLHSEHCRDLERQIEQVQRECEGKNNQISQLDTIIKACRQDLVIKATRVQEVEKALEEHKRELEQRDQQRAGFETMLAKLQAKAKLEAERGVKLDETLKECRQKMNAHIEQLEAAKHKHEQEMKEKMEEINKLKKTLEKCNGDYRERCEETGKLERILSGRNEMLKQHQKRTAELEINQTRLQQQVGILELELGRERETNEEEAKNLQSLLEQARRDLDDRTKQLNELNASLVGVHKDIKQSSSHVVDLEQLLQQTRELLEKKCREASELAETLKETKRKLNENSENYRNLELTLSKTTNKLKEREERVSELDAELSKAQREIQETVNQLKELKNVLENNKKELKEQEDKVNELGKELNESQELLQMKNKEIDEKDAKVSELDQTIRECQWELKQRMSEMSKLDVSMKEQRSDLKQKTNVLEHSLSQYQYELSEKVLEVSELKAKHAQSQEQLKQKSLRLEYMEKTMKQQQQELRKRMNQVTEFEKEFTKLKLDSDDKTEITQELRLSREQVQNVQSELLNARRRLLQYEGKEKELLQELEEAHGLLANKEVDCTRLAKELGSAQVREAQAEARCLQEVRRVEQQHSLKVANYENEIQHLRESHSKLFAQKEEEDATRRLNIQKLRENEKNHEKEIKRLKDDYRACTNHMNHLKRQLDQLQEQAQAANETVVIKESEITRLQAKVSGYERATFGSRLHFDTPDSRLSAMHTRSSSPPSHPSGPKLFPNYQSKTPVKRSNSAHDLHRVSGSLISFGAPATSGESPYEDLDTSPRAPRIILPAAKAHLSNSAGESNTFERLFDQARRELDVSGGLDFRADNNSKQVENKEAETWTSLLGGHGRTNNVERSLNQDDENNQ